MTGRLTDAQFDELHHAIPLLYQGGSLEEDFSPWAREWIGPDGGVLSLLNELKAERERGARAAAELHDMRRRAALVRGMHFQYRAAEDRFDCCAECNRVSRGYVPSPCATYKAITGEGGTPA